MAEPSVAAGFARGLIDYAATKGADPAALAARAGIDPAVLADQDNRIPLGAYVALMRAAKELTGDPAFALHFGEAVDIRDMSTVALLSQACGTMMEAFDSVGRYARLDIDLGMGDVDRLQLARRGGKLWMVDTRPNPNAFPELTESAFARMMGSMARFGVGAPPGAVHVTHKAPAWRAEYDRIFRTRVVFESGWNAVQLDEQLLQLPIALQPRYMFGVLSERAEALLARLKSEGTMRGQVESLLLASLSGGGMSIREVAAAIGVSRQTLYRRLKAEGATFESVRDDLRRRLALEHLGPERRSINETAWLLGFSDRAAFSRAFKRWTGAGPGAMRR